MRINIYMYICIGLSKAAKEEHARDLPLMNGIKEVIKSAGVLDAGSPGYREALSNLSTRLKALQVNYSLFVGIYHLIVNNNSSNKFTSILKFETHHE